MLLTSKSNAACKSIAQQHELNSVFMMKMVLCDKSEIAAIHYVKRGEIYFLFPMKGSLFDTTNTHTGLNKRLSERNRERERGELPLCHVV